MKSKLMTILEKLPLDEAATLDQTDENAAETSIVTQSTGSSFRDINCFTKHRDSCRM